MPVKDKRRGSAVTKAEYEMLAAFRYSLRQFLRFSESVVGEVGLTPQQHQALLAVRGFPSRERLTITELAERLQIKHNSAVGLVDRLASQHLMVRHTATADRRQVHVTLTAQGRRVLERLTALHKDEIRRVGPGLGALLQRLTSASRVKRPGAAPRRKKS